MNKSIFITCYPNTEGKLNTLIECINSVKKSGFPVVVVSNMALPHNISVMADECLIGENIECVYQDFFTSDEIDKARNLSRYLLHFVPPDGESISYVSFSYGKGSTYHWSALSQHFKILDNARKREISLFLVIEGDVILDDNDLYRISENFSLMEEEKLDFIIGIQHNMGHMSGNGWFTTTDHWESVFSDISDKDFLNSTYPNFSSEEYLILKMRKLENRGMILMWDPDNYSGSSFPSSWIVSRTKSSVNERTQESINLFFPETKKIGLSSSIDRKDQSAEDPLSYVWMGVGKRLNCPVFFIWNRYNGETVKEIKAKISIFDEMSSIFHSEFNLPPGEWAWSPIYDMKRNSHCIIEILVIGIDGKEFSFSDRFGSVGDGINIRNLIQE